jgi:myo-inositol-1(or 4)-monophosphatase
MALTRIPPSRSGRDALEVAIEAVKAGGAVILERFHREKRVTHKGRANVLTDVDILSEKAILSLLRREYPEFGVVSEESRAVTGDSGYTWFVDPLDGTRNYVSGIPHCAATLALAYGEEVLLGVTWEPFRGELFRAVKGGGAFLNDRPITVSGQGELRDCLLGFDMGYVDDKALKALKLIQALWPGMQSIRVMGSSALGLAYAACGRIDIYFHHHICPWDVAAGLLLVAEAGGTVADRYGNPATLRSESVIASSPRLVERFLETTRGLEWREG